MTISFDKAYCGEFEDGTWVCLHPTDARLAKRTVAALHHCLYDADIQQHRERRSPDANAYCWALMSKLAEALTAEAQGDIAYSKDEVYLMELKKYGQCGLMRIADRDSALILRDIKYYEAHEKLWGEEATVYKIWVGSSNYNTYEMHLFLCGVIADCRELDIETLTPRELDAMLKRWGDMDAG